MTQTRTIAATGALASTSAASRANIKSANSSHKDRNIGIGVGVGVGVPVVLAAVAGALLLSKRSRGIKGSTPSIEDKTDPFQASVDQYHTTNQAANF